MSLLVLLLAAIAVLALIGLGGFSSMVLMLTLLLDGKKKRLGKKRLFHHASVVAFNVLS